MDRSSQTPQSRWNSKKKTRSSRSNEFKHVRNTQQQNLRLNLIRRGLRGQAIGAIRDVKNFKRIASSNLLLQQKLDAWELIVNCRFAGRLCLVLSLILVPIGSFLLADGMNAKEFRFPYGEDCKNSRNYLRLLRSACIFCGGGHNPSCTKEIVIPQDMRTPVYLYYELENFHQNHRFMVRSMDYTQLRGEIFRYDGTGKEPIPVKPSTNCAPYTTDELGRIYFPCGSMANAMFTDSFTLSTHLGHEVTLRSTKMTHQALRKYKFKNPPNISPANHNYKRSFLNHFVKPKGWTEEVWSEWWKNGGMENERFINWMIPSHKSKFRKLYAVIDSVPHCPDGFVCKGNYSVYIEYRFDADSFNGQKALIFSSPSLIGSRDLFVPLSILFLAGVVTILGFQLLKLADISERERLGLDSSSAEMNTKRNSKRHSRAMERDDKRRSIEEIYSRSPSSSSHPRSSKDKNSQNFDNANNINEDHESDEENATFSPGSSIDSTKASSSSSEDDDNNDPSISQIILT